MDTSTLSSADLDLRKRAKRRVEAKVGFGVHALVFVGVNLLLAAINQMHGGDRWHFWTLGWWGLGLAVHGIVTFLSLSGDGLRQRMVDREFEALKRRQGR